MPLAERELAVAPELLRGVLQRHAVPLQGRQDDLTVAPEARVEAVQQHTAVPDVLHEAAAGGVHAQQRELRPLTVAHGLAQGLPVEELPAAKEQALVARGRPCLWRQALLQLVDR